MVVQTQQGLTLYMDGGVIRCANLQELTGKGCYRKVPCSSGSSTEAQMLHW